MDNINCRSSYYLKQCRSIWIPRNWVFTFLTVTGVLTSALNIPLQFVLFFTYIILLTIHLIEDYYLDFAKDELMDRSYYINFYRCIFLVIVTISWGLTNSVKILLIMCNNES